MNKAGCSTRLYIVAFEFRVAVFREDTCKERHVFQMRRREGNRMSRRGRLCGPDKRAKRRSVRGEV